MSRSAQDARPHEEGGGRSSRCRQERAEGRKYGIDVTVRAPSIAVQDHLGCAARRYERTFQLDEPRNSGLRQVLLKRKATAC